MADTLQTPHIENGTILNGTTEQVGKSQTSPPEIVDASSPQQPRKPRGPSKAQQLNKLYALPAPLRTFPLPTFIPHNPLSLFQILYAWASQVISPTSSHFPELYQGYFSPDTRSVHVTEQRSVRGLWEQGFYGKGNLSRSEPSWLEREKKRRGDGKTVTSEDITRARRAERQQAKWERARKEREAIDQTLAREAATKAEEAPIPVHCAPVDPLKLLALPLSSLVPNGKSVSPKKVRFSETIDPEVHVAIPVEVSTEKPEHKPAENHVEELVVKSDVLVEKPDELLNQEHFQLTLEEAFFLSYSLGALNILDKATHLPIAPRKAFTLFRSNSHFPSQDSSAPDDQFVVSYVVYHHFRSLGWVVRGGTKFSVDYMLYIRGPVFTHAEFAVIILPSYSDPYWSSTKELEVHAKNQERRSWSWLHCVNRVITQVRKTLILVYVDIPRPEKDDADTPIHQLLGRYKIREVVLKRWSSNRSRD
ncbi:tRNA intron endonuclease [Phlyctema vagabunda]|uniref:tRNA-splicing endonuclease subunit Sen2 n=1 Tax=Phlyctema vagabunda TaxID=108571 RepID=A0ABR4PIC5_9HELO